MAHSESVSVGFISLGCSKNLVDAQVMAGFLLDEGIRLAPSPEEADVVVVNTCSFIGEAREEAADTILRVCQHKAAGGCRGLVVTGCLAQRYGRRLLQSFPEVDAFLGVDELDRIGTLVKRVAAGKRGLVAVSATPSRLFNPSRPALSFSGGPFAWLKIAEGCNHACAFCAIPGIRGRLRSRPVDEVVAEARALLGTGARELNVIAQDTTAYGRDLKRRDGLVELLQALDGLEGRFWIRILYGYPSLISDALLETVAASRHICRYFDVPVQHSHPAILRAMRRADTVKPVAALPERIRHAVPCAVLRTTCLVGYPGEGEAHFEHLLSYVEQARFDHLGVFAFSPEAGTAAHGLDGAPTAEVAEARRRRLMQMQRRIVDQKRLDLTGVSAEALLIRRLRPTRGQALWETRLQRQAPEVDGMTRVSGVPEGAQPGEWVQVTVTSGRAYDLAATVRPQAQKQGDR